LDGAWRVLQGQRPHVDFYTALGPLAYLPVALAMRVVGPVPAALPLSSAAFFVMVTLLGTCLAWRRLGALTALAYVLVAAMTAQGLHVLGFEVSDTGYAMLYNRHGFALISLVMLAVLVPAHDPSRARDRFDGFLTGLILAALLFLKISFFFVALAILGAGLLIGSAPVRFWLALLAGHVALGLTILATLGFGTSAVIGDLRMAAAARAEDFAADLAKILDVLHNELGALLALLFCGIVTAAIGRADATVRSRFREFLVVATAAGASLTLIMSNWQWGESPLAAAGALVLVEIGTRRPAEEAHKRLPLLLLLILASGCLTAASIGKNVRGIVFALRDNRTASSHARFDAASLEGLMIVSGGGVFENMPHGSYVEKVNDGIELLRRRTASTERILCLDFSNPFTFALAREAPRHDANWWHVRRNFTEAHHPPESRVFSEVDVVLVPVFEQGGAYDLRRIYGPLLEREYALVAATRQWALLRRKRR
jgi:hypothetical protein